MSVRTEPALHRGIPVPDGAGAVRPPAGRRDRRTLLLVASVALVGASIAGFASVYSAADRKTPAVVLVRAVVQGQRISPADIGEAEVAVSPGVDYIPLRQASIVTGQRAVAAMPAGSLLTPADLTGAPAIAGGDAVVGVALKEGAYPASGLSPGDQVLVVLTAAPGMSVAAPTGGASTASSGTASVPPLVGGTTAAVSGVGAGGLSGGDTGILVPQASVFAVTAPATSSSGGATLLVSLEVPSAVAAQVATASAAGQVGLVLLPQGSGSGATGSPSGATP